MKIVYWVFSLCLVLSSCGGSSSNSDPIIDDTNSHGINLFSVDANISYDVNAGIFVVMWDLYAPGNDWIKIYFSLNDTHSSADTLLINTFCTSLDCGISSFSTECIYDTSRTVTCPDLSNLSISLAQYHDGPPIEGYFILESCDNALGIDCYYEAVSVTLN